MITLGIDLASQPKNTAMATIEWRSRRTVVHKPAEDRAILDAMERADYVGIDAPFGWPDAFVAAISTGDWPDVDTKEMTHRATDHFVHAQTGIWPLSVSSDRIAIPAFRCARLLANHGVTDRVNGPVYEVYPGAALTQWGLQRRGYKADADIRESIVDALPIDMSAARAVCVADDDALDAVLSALVARAAALGLTLPAEDATTAAREGWIHIPAKADLGVLRPRGR